MKFVDSLHGTKDVEAYPDVEVDCPYDGWDVDVDIPDDDVECPDDDVAGLDKDVDCPCNITEVPDDVLIPEDEE